MKYKVTFIITSHLITLSTICMQQISSREILKQRNAKAIKDSLIISYGTPWNTTKKEISSAIKRGVVTVDQEEYDESGYTPLCLALNNDDISFAKFLLEREANPNFDVKGVHSSRPIFFAKSVAMLKLLKSYGANLQEHNRGSGVTGGMNLLHASVNCNTKDDELFDYLLTQGFDPKELVEHGANLWHSLIAVSIRYCPEERFIHRAKKLKKLGISPYQKGDYYNLSAIEYMQKQIEKESTFIANVSKAHPNRVAMLMQMKKFLSLMETI